MKKRMIAMILALVMVFGCTATAYAASGTEEKITRTIIMYDCGSDLETRVGLASYNLMEVVNANFSSTAVIIDATLIQRYDVSLADLNDYQLRAADVDGDGEVTVIDATWIRRYDVQMKAPEGIGIMIVE